jgi:hypothetical protein
MNMIGAMPGVNWESLIRCGRHRPDVSYAVDYLGRSASLWITTMRLVRSAVGYVTHATLRWVDSVTMSLGSSARSSIYSENQMALSNSQVREARSFLRKRNLTPPVSPRTFARSATETGKTFSELLRFIMRLRRGRTQQSEQNQEVILAAAKAGE